MRLGLAAKICILAAVLVVGGQRRQLPFLSRCAIGSARKRIGRPHRRDGESGQGRSSADIDRVQTDLLQLAVAPRVRGLFAEGRDPDPKDKSAAIQLAEQLCQRRRHYRQIDFVRNDARGTVVALFAPDAAITDAAGGTGARRVCASQGRRTLRMCCSPRALSRSVGNCTPPFE